MKNKNLNEEIKRIKSLFTEERLYGNLCEKNIINESILPDVIEKLLNVFNKIDKNLPKFKNSDNLLNYIDDLKNNNKRYYKIIEDSLGGKSKSLTFFKFLENPNEIEWLFKKGAGGKLQFKLLPENVGFELLLDKLKNLEPDKLDDELKLIFELPDVTKLNTIEDVNNLINSINKNIGDIPSNYYKDIKKYIDDYVSKNYTKKIGFSEQPLIINGENVIDLIKKGVKSVDEATDDFLKQTEKAVMDASKLLEQELKLITKEIGKKDVVIDIDQFKELMTFSAWDTVKKTDQADVKIIEMLKLMFSKAFKNLDLVLDNALTKGKKIGNKLYITNEGSEQDIIKGMLEDFEYVKDLNLKEYIIEKYISSQFKGGLTINSFIEGLVKVILGTIKSLPKILFNLATDGLYYLGKALWILVKGVWNFAKSFKKQAKETTKNVGDEVNKSINLVKKGYIDFDDFRKSLFTFSAYFIIRNIIQFQVVNYGDNKGIKILSLSKYILDELYGVLTNIVEYPIYRIYELFGMDYIDDFFGTISLDENGKIIRVDYTDRQNKTWLNIPKAQADFLEWVDSVVESINNEITDANSAIGKKIEEIRREICETMNNNIDLYYENKDYGYGKVLELKKDTVDKIYELYGEQIIGKLNEFLIEKLDINMADKFEKIKNFKKNRRFSSYIYNKIFAKITKIIKESKTIKENFEGKVKEIVAKMVNNCKPVAVSGSDCGNVPINTLTKNHPCWEEKIRGKTGRERWIEWHKEQMDKGLTW